MFVNLVIVFFEDDDGRVRDGIEDVGLVEKREETYRNKFG